MAKLILIRGPPAVGKTTTVNGLKRDKRVDFDTVDVERTNITVTFRHFPRFASEVNEKLREGKNVVVEGIFYKKLVDYFLPHIDKKFEVVIINLYASLNKLIERNRYRWKRVSDGEIAEYYSLLIDDASYLDNTISTEKTNSSDVVEIVYKKI